MGMTTAAFNQDAFRFRSDAGTADTPATWLENEDTNHTHATASTLRIRFQLQETAGGTANNQSWQLEYNRLSGGWNNVDASSTYVQAANGTRADGDNCGTDHLTDSGGTHQGNKGYDDVDGIAGVITTVANSAAEIEFVIQIIDADVNHGDTIQLRANNGNTATWDSIPTLTVSKPGAALAGDCAVSLALVGALSLTVPLGGDCAVSVACQGDANIGAEAVWRSDMDAGSGTTVVDDSGVATVTNGTVSNSDEFEWLSPDGIRLTMPSDGTGGRVQVADTSKLDASGGVTLSIWMRPTIRDQFTMNGRTIDANCGWLTKDDAYTLEGRGHRPTLRINNVVISPVTACDLAPPLGVKTHWVVTWDDTSDAFVFYRDGVNVGSGTHAQTGINNTAKALVIGGVDGVSQSIGAFFSPAVYDEALSASAVAALAAGAADPLVRAPVCIWSYSGSSFDGTDSFSPEGDSLTYFWDFGDATTSTSSAPTKSHSAGEYRVVLRVTDASGNTDYAGQWVRITDPDGGGTSVTVTGGDTIDSNSAYTNPSTTWIIADAPTGGNIFDAWTGDTASLDDASEPFAAVTVAGTSLSFTATYKTDPRSAKATHFFTGRYSEDTADQANWFLNSGSERCVPRSTDDVDIGDDVYDAQRAVVSSAFSGVSIQVAEGRTTAGSRVILDASLTASGTYEVGKDEEGITVHRSGTLSCTNLIVGGPWNNSKGLYYNRGGTVSCTNLYIGRDPTVGDDHESNCAFIQTSGSLTASTATVVDTTYTFLLGVLDLRGGTASLAALEVDEGIFTVDSGLTSVAATTITLQAGGTLRSTGAGVQNITASGNVTLASGSTVDMSDSTAPGGWYDLITSSGTLTDNGVSVTGAGWSSSVVSTTILRLTKTGTAPLVGDCAVSLASQGDLTVTAGTAALAGDCAVSAAAQGALSLDVELAGDCALSAAAAGALSIDAPLAGDCALSVASQGDMTATLALAGDAVLSVAAQGAASLTVGLGGDTAVSLAAQGAATLTVGLGGDCSVVVASQGTLSVEAPLVGDCAVVVASAGALSLTAGLAGDCAVSVASQGDLSIAAGAALAGDCSVVVASAGTLSVEAMLAGDAAVVVAAAGDLEINAPLGGDCAVVVASQGSLSIDAPLGGNCTVDCAASGALSARAALAGGCALSVAAQGNATITVGLGGDCAISVASAGDLTVTAAAAALAGDCAVSVAAAGTLSVEAPLAGDCAVVVGAQGDLTPLGGTVSLAGNCTVVLMTVGKLRTVVSAGAIISVPEITNLALSASYDHALVGSEAITAGGPIIFPELSLGPATSVVVAPQVQGPTGDWFDVYDANRTRVTFTMTSDFRGAVVLGGQGAASYLKPLPMSGANWRLIVETT